MKVEDVCVRSVRSCTKESTLADAGNLMWEGNCDALPVVDEVGRVVGIIFDRDVCMAAAVTGQPASAMPVRVAFHPRVHTCRMLDGVRDALRTMRIRRVRRLPVVDGADLLQGMLSLEDLARAAKPDREAGSGDISFEDLALALKMIGAPPEPEGARVVVLETATNSPIREGGRP